MGQLILKRGRAIDELSVWAVRYALGRATYAVHNVVETLIANAECLSDRSKTIIIEDIDRRSGTGELGMEMDRVEWMRLRALLAGVA